MHDPITIWLLVLGVLLVVFNRTLAEAQAQGRLGRRYRPGDELPTRVLFYGLGALCLTLGGLRLAGWFTAGWEVTPK